MSTILYPKNIDIKDWADRYGIKVFSHECKECGNILVADIPFVIEGWRGFTSETCECGKCKASCAVEIACKKEWQEIFKIVKGE